MNTLLRPFNPLTGWQWGVPRRAQFLRANQMDARCPAFGRSHETSRGVSCRWGDRTRLR